MKIITLAGMLLLLAGCTWGDAASAVGSAILWNVFPPGKAEESQSESPKLVCHPVGETVVDPTTECPRAPLRLRGGCS
jgi:hypothetical protein